MKAEGDYQGQVHSGQMVLVKVKQGDWTLWAVATGTQAKLNLKGDHQPRVHLGQMFLW